MFEQGHRAVGVKIPEGQINDRTDKPDLTILSMMEARFFPAEYVENGKRKPGLFVLHGGRWYLAPNGAQWLAGMRELSPKMTGNAQEIFDRLDGSRIPDDVPTEDVVDVIAKATAQEQGGVDVVPEAASEAASSA